MKVPLSHEKALLLHGHEELRPSHVCRLASDSLETSVLLYSCTVGRFIQKILRCSLRVELAALVGGCRPCWLG